MFTGIVKDVGRVVALRQQGSGVRLAVEYTSRHEFQDLDIDESVAVNGACQTVVAMNGMTFEVDTIAETLKKTTLGSLRAGQSVNLERALRPQDRLGGHFVQGHVDCVGTVGEIDDLGESRRIWISYPEAFEPLLVPVGSIAIDGVSLTVASVRPGAFSVAIIPYTFGHTTISSLRPGTAVNLEFDILGKYIARQHQLGEGRGAGKETAISDAWLKEMGY
ncbi:riboflavin synthase [Prosthecochloris sp. N3]|uniref:Riboflavin synthase n=1 Tax=Prosthecochloris ethylica TaxID=2743976 RepID=A0ABR9XSJ4_9CHLB|nr:MULTISPECIES: riboflavin synthase [Prosthecochloris]MEC9487590.1 riboflavin synthase [Prosthecochloris sp.]MBF0586640.1 riboflavin synthase [Prosthecochloris ethylica]MBF0637006.1 riboflavin synthase [Prosthecochloris ethylica]NUK47877.1 riboflavin synthase [Prosthecochloris ethylica]RNA65110.1 riboflavin synthase [Prosthecochloris sp. ZM_2]